MQISIKLTGMNLSRQINTTISQKNNLTRKLGENTGAVMFFLLLRGSRKLFFKFIICNRII